MENKMKMHPKPKEFLRSIGYLSLQELGLFRNETLWCRAFQPSPTVISSHYKAGTRVLIVPAQGGKSCMKPGLGRAIKDR